MQIAVFKEILGPITSSMGFIQCMPDVASRAFIQWQQPIQAARGVELARREVLGDFPSRAEELLPLTSVEARRFLFAPTRSSWSAYLDNGWRGTDAYSVVSTLCQSVGCRGLRVVCREESATNDAGRGGGVGATILEVYEASTVGCQFLNTRRSIFVANDGGKWRFEANGDQLEFERPEYYSASRVRERFTPSILGEYLQQLGIEFFSSDFYEAGTPSFVVSKIGPSAKGLREYSLSDL